MMGVFMTACASLPENQQLGQQVAFKKQGEAYQYLRYMPKNYEQKGEKSPVLIFLHGSGERGEDISRVKVHGPPHLVDSGRDLPFIVISPQLEDDQMWDNARLDATLKTALSGTNYDVNRIYVTGLSRGGAGTWNWAIAHPDKFAAIIPIAGWSNVGFSCNLKNMPIWVFHGLKDDVVSPIHSKDMERWINECGGKVKATYYPDANHNSWTVTYDNPEIYDWLLQHKLQAK
jgi:predicted peptidase